MRIIDLSLPIDEKAFEVHKVEIERVGHKAGVKKFNRVIMGKTIMVTKATPPIQTTTPRTCTAVRIEMSISPPFPVTYRR